MPTMQRTHAPEPGVVMFVMPFGVKDGFNYDSFYSQILKPKIESMGLTPQRVDEVYGEQSMLEVIWRTIQRAEIIVADFSHRSVNVGLEVGWGMILGKRIITIAQTAEDIPTDLRGLNRYLVYPTSLNYLEIEELKDQLEHHLEALRDEPVEEMALVPYAGYAMSKAPAKVIAVAAEYATVRTDDGNLGFLTGSEIDYTRVYPDVQKRLRLGDHVDGAFVVDIRTKLPKYTLLLPEDNPWPEIASSRKVGTAFTSVVTNVTSAGVFVRVLGKINGLVPRSSFPTGADPKPGDEIHVVVMRLDIDARRIGLALAHPQWETPTRQAQAQVRHSPVPATPLPQIGQEFEGTIHRIVPAVNNAKGGFLLVALPGFERPAMLHVTAMTDELADEFNAGKLQIGEPIDVRVKAVEATKNKVLLEDLAEDEDDAGVVTPTGPVTT